MSLRLTGCLKGQIVEKERGSTCQPYQYLVLLQMNNIFILEKTITMKKNKFQLKSMFIQIRNILSLFLFEKIYFFHEKS